MHLVPTTWASLGSGVGAVYTLGDSGFKVSGNYLSTAMVLTPTGDAVVASAPTVLTSVHHSSWQLFYGGEAFDGTFLAQQRVIPSIQNVGNCHRLPALSATALTAKADQLLWLSCLVDA